MSIYDNTVPLEEFERRMQSIVNYQREHNCHISPDFPPEQFMRNRVERIERMMTLTEDEQYEEYKTRYARFHEKLTEEQIKAAFYKDKARWMQEYLEIMKREKEEQELREERELQERMDRMLEENRIIREKVLQDYREKAAQKATQQPAPTKQKSSDLKGLYIFLAIALAVALAIIFLTSCGKDAITEEDLEHAYGSGYEAGMEAADEAKYHANKSSPLPVENREPTVSMVSTPDSSCFSSVGYDDGTLYVTFRDSGSVYSYEDVPSYVYDELWSASSMGGYYNSSIKGYYECHRLS